jgi:holo-[acyl-carrier protein] synthase
MIGVDIIKISRIKSSIGNFNNKFIKRVFHPDEIEKSELLAEKQKIAYFAKRFAAKEAFIKAKGNKLDIKFADICIKNDQYGKPIVYYKNEKLENAEISLSDNGDYAIAFMLLK